MKTLPILTLCLGIAVAGCNSPRDGGEAPRGVDSLWAMESIIAAEVNRAIIRQSALFPYHFINGSAELNPLGRRDLNVLTDHFQNAPSLRMPRQLRIRQGVAGDELYMDRIEVVLESLMDAGILREDIRVTQNINGGDGMTSDRLVNVILESEAEGTDTIQDFMAPQRGGQGGGS
jgi:hypothetical protein